MAIFIDLLIQSDTLTREYSIYNVLNFPFNVERKSKAYKNSG